MKSDIQIFYIYFLVSFFITLPSHLHTSSESLKNSSKKSTESSKKIHVNQVSSRLTKGKILSEEEIALLFIGYSRIGTSNTSHHVQPIQELTPQVNELNLNNKAA